MTTRSMLLAGMAALIVLTGVTTAEANAPLDTVASLQPGSGKSAKDCDVCPEMVVVPAGSFLMGSSKAEIAALKKDYPVPATFFEWEGPQRRVTVRQPFAVGRFSITRGEFAKFVTETGHDTDGGCVTRPDGDWNWKLRADMSWQSVGFEQTDSHPVVCVSWDDVARLLRSAMRRGDLASRRYYFLGFRVARSLGPR
jgi:formylglycine-generating enzyme required for sulfatase activity